MFTYVSPSYYYKDTYGDGGIYIRNNFSNPIMYLYNGEWDTERFYYLDDEDGVYKYYNVYDDEGRPPSASGNDLTLYGGKGNDFIENNGSNVVIDVGAGNDKVINSDSSGASFGANVYINGGTGDDFLYSRGRNSKIYGGDDNDTIGNEGADGYLDGGTGNDSIATSAENTKLIGGKGDDTLESIFHAVKNFIDGGEDNDHIYTNGNSTSIDAGSGNDIIDIDDGATNVSIKAGIGNDIIYGFNDTSILEVAAPIKGIKTVEGDMVITTSKGSVTLKDFSSVNVQYNAPEFNLEYFQKEIANQVEKNFENLMEFFENNAVMQSILKDGAISPYPQMLLGSFGPIIAISLKESYEIAKILKNLETQEDYQAILLKLNNQFNDAVGTANELLSALSIAGKLTLSTGKSMLKDRFALFFSIKNVYDKEKLLSKTKLEFQKKYPGVDIDDDIQIVHYKNLIGDIFPVVCPNSKIRDLDPEKYDEYFLTEIEVEYAKTALAMSLGTIIFTTHTTAIGAVIGSFFPVPVGGTAGGAIVGATVGEIFAFGTSIYLRGKKAATKAHYLNNVHPDEQNFVLTYTEQFFDLDYGYLKNVFKGKDDSSTSKNIAELQVYILNSDFPENVNARTIDITESTLIYNSKSIETNSTLSGSGDKDTIFNAEDNVFIEGGEGDDEITNIGDYVIIDAGMGNDYVANIGDYVEINGSMGNNNIENAGVKVTVNIAYGDNYFGNNGDSITVNAGNGNNYFDNIGNFVVIQTGNGENDVENFGSNVRISTGNGADFIDNYGNDTTINSGSGNDTIYHSYGSNVLINAGDGDDLIKLKNLGSNNNAIVVTVIGGKGNDVIYSAEDSKSLFQYRAGDGNDTIYGLTENDSLQILDTAYTSIESGNDIVISVGNESILVKDVKNMRWKIIRALLPEESKWTIIGNIATYVTLSNTLITIKGVKTIDGVIIDTVSKNITISNVALDKNNITISDDSYTLKLADDVPKPCTTAANWSINGTTATYKAGATTAGYSLSSDRKTISYSEEIGGETFTITGLKNGLSVKNGTIEGIRIKDNVVMVSSNIIGDDEVKIVGDGYTLEIVKIVPIPEGISIKNNVLTVSSKFTEKTVNLKEEWATGVTKVNASAISHDLNILSNDSNTSITAGKGADTIFAGLGNDTITGGAGKDIFIYAGGNDVITDYKSGEDQINLNLADVTNSSVKGSDVILTTDEGTLTIKGTKDKAVTFVDDSGAITDLIFFANTYYEPLEKGLTYDAKRTVLTASNKFTGDEINLEEYLGTATEVNASALSRNINIVGNENNNSIKSGKGSDTINGGIGNDTLSGGVGDDSIFGGSGNDKLLGDAGNDTLYGGEGNDTLTGGAGKDVFVYESGKDLITDYKVGEDQIKLNLADVTNSSVKGSDVILTTDEGTLTIKGTKDKTITFTDDNGADTDLIFFADTSYSPLETGLTYDAKRTVLTASAKFNGNEIDLSDYLSTVSKVNAPALKQGVNILGNRNNNSIKGGKGADTISGELGKNTLTGGAGKDVFVYAGGNDVITDYKVAEDKININLADVTKTSVKGSDVILTTDEGTLTIKGTKDKAITFTDDSDTDTNLIFFADTSYSPLEDGLTYDAKRTVLTASNKFKGEEIDLGEYLETVTKVNASALSKAVTLMGNENNNSIKGGKGSDTINGGNGNDTLTGGAGRDVFVYEDGNDVITDYKSGEDSIKIDGKISGTSYKGKDVIFTVGNGSLTVKGIKGKEISVTDSSGKTQPYYQTLDLLYDNNFVADEFSIADVVDINENNYSVGKLEYTNNNNDFANNSIVSASYLDEMTSNQD